MTRLRKMMLEELQRRNYSAITTRNYLRVVTEFAKYFGKPPDRLGLNELRTYQAYLLRERELTPGTVVNQVAALRFFFVKTLKRYQFRDFLPYPQDRRRLPTVLSREEVSHLINAAGNLFRRTLLMTLYGTGMRRAELARLKVSDIDSQRMIIRVVAGKGGKDRDLPLSPSLLETLREYWRWRKPKLYLFPTRTLSRRLDQPISDKTVWIACSEAAIEQEITAELRELRELLSKCSTLSVAGMCFAKALAPDESPDRLMSPAKQIAFMLGVLLQDPEPSGAENFAQAEWARAKRILGRLFNAYLLLYMPSPDEPAPTPEWRASCEVAMPAFLQHFNTGLLATIEQVADRVTRYLIPYDSDLIRILGISASECIEICAWINDHLQQTLDDVADRVDAAKREHNMLRQASVTQISSPRPDHFTASMRPEFAGVFSSLQKVGIISLQDLQVAFPEKGLTF